jgi:SAM-dependent methyltransferase
VLKNKQCLDSRCMLYHSKASNSGSFKKITNITREGDGLWEKCNDCGLVINRTGIQPDKVEEYYNEKYRDSHSFSKGEILSLREHLAMRTPSILPVYDYLKPYLNNETRLLELGCGVGELLQLLSNDVWYCFGIELNSQFIDFINKELNIKSAYGNYCEMEFETKFNLIVSLYTIDHMYDTLEVIQKFYKDLEPDGLLYLELPNDEQALRTKLPESTRKNFEQFMYQEAHYYSFTFETISMILEQTGLQILDTSCRHSYTLKNFLSWYFTGLPQKQFFNATTELDFFSGNSEFETEMNNFFIGLEPKFQSYMRKHLMGESICILAQKK